MDAKLKNISSRVCLTCWLSPGMSGRFAHLSPAAQRAAEPGQACTTRSRRPICFCGQVAPKRKHRLESSMTRRFSPPFISPISQLGNFSPLPLSFIQESWERKGWKQGWYLLRRKKLSTVTLGRPLCPHSIINTSIKMGQVCFLLLSMQDWRQCIPEDRGMRKTKQRWRCNVWHAAESGTLQNGSFSVFNTVLIQGQGNCLFNTVF